MNELIENLLKTNGRVIIPDFGALIVKQKVPFKVIFNEFLQYNDGALINAIMLNQHIDLAEATIRAKELSDNLNTSLNSGNEIKLPGIGILVKNASGKISLFSELEHEAEEEVTPQNEVDEPIKLPEVEFILNSPNEPSQEQKSAKTPPVKEVEKPETQKAATHSSPVTEYYNEEPQKRWLNIVLWITLIVIVNGAIFGFFFFGNEIKSVFHKKTKTENELKPDITETVLAEETADSLIENSTLPAEELTEPIPVETTEAETPVKQQLNPAGTKYYIVAGVFKEEHNADNLVNTLRKKGYNAEKFGKIGQMWAVSYNVFPSKREADNYLIKLKDDNIADAWIRIID